MLNSLFATLNLKVMGAIVCFSLYFCICFVIILFLLFEVVACIAHMCMGMYMHVRTWVCLWCTEFKPFCSLIWFYCSPVSQPTSNLQINEFFICTYMYAQCLWKTYFWKDVLMFTSSQLWRTGHNLTLEKLTQLTGMCPIALVNSWLRGSWGIERGGTQLSSLKGWERAIISQTNIGTV